MDMLSLAKTRSRLPTLHCISVATVPGMVIEKPLPMTASYTSWNGKQNELERASAYQQRAIIALDPAIEGSIRNHTDDRNLRNTSLKTQQTDLGEQANRAATGRVAMSGVRIASKKLQPSGNAAVLAQQSGIARHLMHALQT